ncbi:YifB family Mg chelatase-like AAA ATPase [Arthrobacter halodurans]|uniref:YifB family Mg chelatase-like AAA ATPase n=1 Tax=Arthrobacter halodurans TaxID=516699 RepID=A0ABV4UHZ6_9MICC
MSLGRAAGVALIGLNGSIVDVEADIGGGLPGFVLLGLPDASLAESRDRIRSAARNSGVPLSPRRITVNLVPASLPKRGSSFDLAIVVAALAAAGDISSPPGVVFIAELGLDGCLRPVSGVLPSVMACVAAGRPRVVVAAENHAEASLVPGADITSHRHLAEVLGRFGADPHSLRQPAAARRAETANGRPSTGGATPGRAAPDRTASDRAALDRSAPDMADIVGQLEARYALEVAAAGGHHLLLMGPPGAGKTMLAERLPGILPDLTDTEAMETTAVHSLGGGQRGLDRLLRRPPFESPHHSASMVALIGGGSGLPRPGAASRAHRGVLFLDEAPEFAAKALDSLRQPLESGRLTLHRAAGAATYPARFQLVLAANPCPCGLSTGKGIDCTCTPMQRRRYLDRLSGPLLDRIDLQIGVPRVAAVQLRGGVRAEDSAAVGARVAAARELQRARLDPLGLSRNADLPGTLLRGELALPPAVTAGADRELDRGRLTARGYDRVLRIAWTVGDLARHDRPSAGDVDVALQLRQHAKGETP